MPPTEQQIIGRLNPAIAKNLLKRGLRVRNKAVKLLSGAGGAPKRVNTGILRSSIRVELRSLAGVPVVRIGTNKKYARWVHDGTGIYGPHRQKIYPRRAQALVFSSKKFGAKKGAFKGKVVVRSVKGMKKNQFLKNALPAARL